VASYLVLNPAQRLMTLSFGLAMACLGWAGTLSAESAHEGRFESKVLGLILGLILSSTAKFIWQTNNPIWPIMHAENGGWNGVGLAIGVLAVLRSTSKAPLTSAASSSSNQPQKGSSLLAACGIGGLLFGLHSLLSDSSTMILWVWEGFPIRGPYFSTHGWCTIVAMTLGVFLGVSKPNFAGGYLHYIAGTTGAMVLTFYSHWFGYFGALALAVYLTAVSVPLLSAAARKSPAVSFGLGFFIYNFLVLFHVWVVAYAFVPGGPLVRERTDWVMMTMMTLIGLGVINFNFSKPRKTAKRHSVSQHKKYFGVAAIVINIAFFCATYVRFPTNDYKPFHGEDRVLTAGIWTIHFSLDNDMWSSEYRMAQLLKEAELDVIGLLETDQQRIIMGNRDSTQLLAEELGMYVDYGPGPNKHTWGSALLSKFPIVESEHHLLPSPVGELAPAIHATLDVYGQLIDVFVFHSGQEEDPEDRRLQSEYLSKLMGSTPRPSILLSYLVTRPLQGNYNTYVSEQSGMHDVDPTDWDRWCEYILFKGLKRIGYARISRSTITDTELQVAKFIIPRSEGEIQEQKALTAEQRDRRVHENDVPAGWRFPALLRGEGVRGHRYHVFDEPRYYN
jgi:hypothetical protein